MQTKQVTDANTYSLSELLKFLDGFQINFDFQKDSEVYLQRHPETAKLFRKEAGQDNAKFEELLSNSRHFQRERNTYHWNLINVLKDAKPLDEKSIKKFTERLLKSPTLFLSDDQLEAIAYLTGVGKLSFPPRRRLKISNYSTNNFLDNKTKLAFNQVERVDLAAELLTRIISPATIDQKDESLCGPTTLIQIIARDNPLGYVEYVTKLAEEGIAPLSIDPDHTGSVMQVDVRTHKGLRAGSSNLAMADYIALASLRASENNTEKQLNGINSMLFGVTFDTEVLEWMRKSGFLDVHSVHIGGTKDELRNQIKQLSRLVTRGYELCFRTSSSLGDKIIGSYDLSLMPKDLTNIEPNRIYLEIKGDQLIYRLTNPEDSKKIIQDSIILSKLDIEAPLTSEKLTKNLLDQILEITTRSKHTDPQEKLPPNFVRSLVDGHYIHLRAISLDKENPNFVHIKMSTWGAEYSRKLTLDELAGFFEGNAALAGMTFENYKSYGRTLSLSKSKTGKSHPYVYLKYLKTELMEGYKGSKTTVVWNNCGQLREAKIDERFLPLVPLLNQLRPSMTEGEYLDLAIEVQNWSKIITMRDNYRKDFFEGNTFQFIPRVMRHLRSVPKSAEEFIPLITAIIIQHDDSYKQLQEMVDGADAQSKAIFAKINKQLDAEYRNNFEIPFQKYRKHLLDEMHNMGRGFGVSNRERQAISKASLQLTQGQVIEELALPGAKSLSEELNKCIRKANAINRALNHPSSEFNGCEAIRHAWNSLTELREGQQQTDLELIKADRSSPAMKLAKAILTFFACLLILPIGFMIAKSLINQERTGNFSVYTSEGSHLIGSFFNYDEKSRKRIVNEYVSPECFNIELAYDGRPKVLQANTIYLYLEGDEIFYTVKQGDEVINEPMYKPHIEQYEQSMISKLKKEGATLTHNELKRLQFTFSQKGYFTDEENSGKLSQS